MNNIGGESKFIGFLDECGDHSMTKIDADFPLFVLALVIFERKVYPWLRVLGASLLPVPVLPN